MSRLSPALSAVTWAKNAAARSGVLIWNSVSILFMELTHGVMLSTEWLNAWASDSAVSGHDQPRPPRPTLDALIWNSVSILFMVLPHGVMLSTEWLNAWASDSAVSGHDQPRPPRPTLDALIRPPPCVPSPNSEDPAWLALPLWTKPLNSSHEPSWLP